MRTDKMRAKLRVLSEDILRGQAYWSDKQKIAQNSWDYDNASSRIASLEKLEQAVYKASEALEEIEIIQHGNLGS